MAASFRRLLQNGLSDAQSTLRRLQRNHDLAITAARRNPLDQNLLRRSNRSLAELSEGNARLSNRMVANNVFDDLVARNVAPETAFRYADNVSGNIMNNTNLMSRIPNESLLRNGSFISETNNGAMRRTFMDDAAMRRINTKSLDELTQGGRRRIEDIPQREFNEVFSRNFSAEFDIHKNNLTNNMSRSIDNVSGGRIRSKDALDRFVTDPAGTERAVRESGESYVRRNGDIAEELSKRSPTLRSRLKGWGGTLLKASLFAGLLLLVIPGGEDVLKNIFGWVGEALASLVESVVGLARILFGPIIDSIFEILGGLKWYIVGFIVIIVVVYIIRKRLSRPVIKTYSPPPSNEV